MLTSGGKKASTFILSPQQCPCGTVNRAHPRSVPRTMLFLGRPSFTNFSGELPRRLCEFRICRNPRRPSFTNVDEELTRRLCEFGFCRNSRRPGFSTVNGELAGRLCEFGFRRSPGVRASPTLTQISSENSASSDFVVTPEGGASPTSKED